MGTTLLIVAAVAAIWIALSLVVALGIGRAVRIAETRRRDAMIVARPLGRSAARAR